MTHLPHKIAVNYGVINIFKTTSLIALEFIILATLSKGAHGQPADMPLSGSPLLRIGPQPIFPVCMVCLW
jgi:hypothetical protein